MQSSCGHFLTGGFESDNGGAECDTKQGSKRSTKGMTYRMVTLDTGIP